MRPELLVGELAGVEGEVDWRGPGSEAESGWLSGLGSRHHT